MFLGDKNTVPALDPMQVITWDGVGGVADSFDYSGTLQLPPGNPIPDPGPGFDNVDALANNHDALFFSVIANTSALLFSVTGNGNILFESVGGGSGIWAAPPQIDHHGVTDVDALEVWGPELFDDSDRFSLQRDFGGVAIWAFTPPGGPSVPFVTDAQIAGAIGRPDLVDEIDLDGLMTSGENLLFSIRPIFDAQGNVIFDGGEIWTWTVGGPPAVFLNHGGHLWNTAFNVMGTFGVNNENVNALEAVSAAVPEPGTITLICVGIVCALGCSPSRRTGAAASPMNRQ